MCLLAVLYKVVPDYPVVLAANRDEFYDRQGAPPQLWEVRGTRFLAPRDDRAGGTWIGCNSRRMAAAVTNRAQPSLDGGVRSRGLLCADVLASESPAEAAQLLRNEIARNSYNGFNLFCADPSDGFIVRYDGRLHFLQLDQGIYVIGNGDLNDESSWKVRRTHELLGRMDLTHFGSLIKDLQALCADHMRPGPGDHWQGDSEPICVHGEKHGTLSSTIIAMADASESGVYLHAQGKPCTAHYQSYSSG